MTSAANWLAIVVFMPVFAPVFCLAVTYLPLRGRLPTEAQRRARILVLFKDGQLGWPGVSLCSAALWEMSSATSHGHGLGEFLDVSGLVYFVVLIVVNAAFVVGGALFPSELPRPAGKSLHASFPVLRSSVAAFAASSGGFAVVHFALIK
jgi:hypothetical protein